MGWEQSKATLGRMRLPETGQAWGPLEACPGVPSTLSLGSHSVQRTVVSWALSLMKGDVNMSLSPSQGEILEPHHQPVQTALAVGRWLCFISDLFDSSGFLEPMPLTSSMLTSFPSFSSSLPPSLPFFLWPVSSH